MVTGIELAFPGLVGKDYEVISPKDEKYNCIAWAVGVADDWWWPDEAGKGHWPPNVPREVTVDAFRAAFETLDFEPCSTEKYEAGFEKSPFTPTPKAFRSMRPVNSQRLAGPASLA